MPTLAELITTPKEIVAVRPRAKSNPGHMSVDLPVRADIGGLSIFIRLSERLVEVFSIGLRYDEPGRETVVVLRVNGDHGPHRNPDGTVLHGPHVHEPDAIQMDAPPPPAFHAKHAHAIGGEFRILGRAWDLFCQLTAIQANVAVARLVAKLHTERAQENLDGFD